MEQEQSNCLAGIKVTGKGATYTGIVFCIALIAFIVGVSVAFGLMSVAMIFVFGKIFVFCFD